MFWLRNKEIFFVQTLNLRPEPVKPIIKVYTTAIKKCDTCKNKLETNNFNVPSDTHKSFTLLIANIYSTTKETHQSLFGAIMEK